MGSIVVESSISGILGDVTFGDGSPAEKFRASIPLDRKPNRRAAFGHVANGGGFYTGLAVFNPFDEAANLNIKVYKTDGALSGSSTVTLSPRGRFSKLLLELVVESTGQLGGYFVVEADREVSSFALFGASDLSSLSAIPAQ
ncbi:MAG: hypothetical protein HY644_14260 [Acidobacteria bacterium]|nr:hypothetical protein [Acidobacteriota bacterium]